MVKHIRNIILNFMDFFQITVIKSKWVVHDVGATCFGRSSDFGPILFILYHCISYIYGMKLVTTIDQEFCYSYIKKNPLE